MIIDKASWHCRVYLWWYRHRYRYPNERGVSNLCPYMRVVLFWAPIRAVFGHWLKIGRVPVNAVTIPAVILSAPVILTHFDRKAGLHLWLFYGCLLLGFAVLSALLYLIFLISPDGEDLGGTFARRVKGSGFATLFGAYLRSAHDRVCPEVQWSATTETSERGSWGS